MINQISNMPSNFRKYYLNTAISSSSCDNNSPSTIENDKLSKKQKVGVLLSSIFGMSPVLAFWSYKKGFSLNPIKIIKTPIKNWALFKCKPLDKVLDYGAAQIITTAIGSVAGGFVGGVILDKNHIKDKKRECLNQLLGDVIVPIACVWVGAKIFKHFEKTLKNLMPKINKDSKGANIINAISENIPNALATITSLGVGIIAGNRVSNEINERLYKKKVDRGIKATDFAPHVDDVCMSVSMINEGSTLGVRLGRVIPFALIVPGYETGTARNK